MNTEFDNVTLCEDCMIFYDSDMNPIWSDTSCPDCESGVLSSILKSTDEGSHYITKCPNCGLSWDWWASPVRGD